MDKSYRIKANVSQETKINVKLQQDVKTLEILSLNLTQENFYKLHQSSYGVIIGRVLANDAFGVPNAKVSVFIKLDDDDVNDTDITNLYPYTSVQSFDSDNRRYNLLPDSSTDDCYRIVGTFPNKRLVLDDDSVLDVYDKYWKYTTVTNNAGDYMIFGVPSGSQEIHVDLDLSDIGVLSQRPRDMLYKGYNIEQFDSPTQFKESTNLYNLSQIISQNQAVDVYPFWGNEDGDLGEVAITRCDISVDYKFEPTCVFMGSLVTDTGGQMVSHECTPTKFCGFNRDLIAGEGMIEMIRKTIDGLTEDYQIKGNSLIDENGIWCYQIPMNLDYVQTDEYGNIVPTDNPNKGIPTRTRVRFRMSFSEENIDGESKHRARYLVPNNPTLATTTITPRLDKAGEVYESYYEFGSSTPEDCYRNLYWNKVYSVKSFIPRLQTANKTKTQNYTGIRSANLSNDLNPFPFNHARFKIYFSYRIICWLLTFLVYMVTLLNTLISAIDTFGILLIKLGKIIRSIWIIRKVGNWFIKLGELFCIECIRFGGGLTEDDDSNTFYYPGCSEDARNYCTPCPDDAPNCEKIGDAEDLIDVIQQNLAQEYDTVNFDFYNDWVNGCLYFPIWYWKKTKKKSFLFGLFKWGGENTYCKCSSGTTYSKLINDNLNGIRKSFPKSVTSPDYTEYKNLDSRDGDEDWEKRYWNPISVKHGIIKETENKAHLKIYYYSYGSVNDGTYQRDRRNSKSFSRLFATDIILLGSFNDCDLDGIPQLYKYLPTTTANIPLIRKIVQTNTSDEDAEEGSQEERGEIVFSGMDWLHDGDDQKPLYSAGLIMDLSCHDVGTRLKTNVNLERMSELGVTLDMSYRVPYNDGSSTLFYYQTSADGLITRYEINNNESRYMFASLNHLGLETLVKDESTTYQKYKIGALYPMDFDGMLTTAKAYTLNAKEKTYDNQDIDYVEFRLGKYPHAYLNTNGSTYYPLYNNSFYFYFGLNDGNTAIDKFRKQYDANCSKIEKYAFGITLTSTSAAWCKHLKHEDYATITATLVDVSTPYSFTLYDNLNKLIFSGSNLYDKTIYFGESGEEKDGELVLTKDKTHYYCGDNYEINHYGEEDEADYYLTNKEYTLVVTDNRKKTVSKVIQIPSQNLNLSVSSTDLSVKYYNPSVTQITDICDDNEDYGTITISEVYIDGFKYNIVGITADTQTIEEKEVNGYVLRLDKPMDDEQYSSITYMHDIEYIFVYFEVKPIEYPEDTDYDVWLDNKNLDTEKNCGCQDTKTEANQTIPTYVLDSTTHELEFRVWMPTDYKLTAIQYCDYMDKNLNDNIYKQTITINNGVPLGAILDDMPVEYLMGDSTYFYRSKLFSYTTPQSLSSWFDIPKVDTRANIGITSTTSVYTIPNYYTQEGRDKLQDYMSTIEFDVDTKVTTYEGAMVVFENILNWAFSLANATYISSKSSGVHNFSLTGGSKPYLYRTFKPRYDSVDEDTTLSDEWYLDSYGDSSVDEYYPDIWSKDIKWNNSISTNQAIFDDKLDDKRNFYLSSYFAGFTKNGGFLEGANTTDYYDGTGVKSYPNNAYVFPNDLPRLTDKQIYFQDDGYKDDVIGSGKYNAYFPAPFIDRRLDYDFVIYTMSNAPKAWGSIPFSSLVFIQGMVVNGIEIGYDVDAITKEKNIISYNESTPETTINADYLILKVDEDKYAIQYNDESKPKYYASTMNNKNILDNYYSTFNTDLVYHKYNEINDSTLANFTSGVTNWESNATIIYNKNYANGKFGSNCYMAKRFLSVMCPTSKNIAWSLTSCSYDTTVQKETVDDATVLKCYPGQGESASFTFTPSKMIKINTIQITSATVKSWYNVLCNATTFNTKGVTFQRSGIRLEYFKKGDETTATYTASMPLYFVSNAKVLEAMAYLRNKSEISTSDYTSFGNKDIRVHCNNVLYNLVESQIDNSINQMKDKMFGLYNYADNDYLSDGDDDTDVSKAIYYYSNDGKYQSISENATDAYGKYEQLTISNLSSSANYMVLPCIRKYDQDGESNLRKGVNVMNFSEVYYVPNLVGKIMMYLYTGSTKTSLVSFLDLSDFKTECNGDYTSLISAIGEKVYVSSGGTVDVVYSSQSTSAMTDSICKITTAFDDWVITSGTDTSSFKIRREIFIQFNTTTLVYCISIGGHDDLKPISGTKPESDINAETY